MVGGMLCKSDKPSIIIIIIKGPLNNCVFKYFSKGLLFNVFSKGLLYIV